MRFFLLLLWSTSLFFQSLSAQEGSNLLTGTVMSQDGNPISHAQILLRSYGITYTGETDEEGKYSLHAQITDGHCDVDVIADGYPPLRNYQIRCKTDEPTIVRDFTLYDIISYQTNTPATIILPVRPDPSLGKYYRMDSISSPFKICFECEPVPQANVPYIVVPVRDFEIRTGDYDISLEPGRYEVAGKDTLTDRSNALFAGSYNTLDTKDCKEREVFFLLDTTSDCFPSENGIGVVVGAFHAYFKMRDMVDCPEIIFNGESTRICGHLNEAGHTSELFNLQGRRVGTGSAPSRGVYIKGGKKVLTH